MSEVVIKQLLPCPTLLPLNRSQPSLMLTSVLFFIVKQQFTQREDVCDTRTLFLLFFFGIVSELSTHFWCSHNRNKQYLHSPSRLNFTRCYLLLLTGFNPPTMTFIFTGTLWYNFNILQHRPTQWGRKRIRSVLNVVPHKIWLITPTLTPPPPLWCKWKL